MKFAKVVYSVSGIWSLLVLTPLFFLRDRLGEMDPPAITHPDYYYGFLCVGLSWAIVFFLIAGNPQRFRPIMLGTMAEKFGYGFFSLVLFLHGQTSASKFSFASCDLVFGVLFLIAFLKLKDTPQKLNV